MRSLAGDLVPAPFSADVKKKQNEDRLNFGREAGNIECLSPAGGVVAKVPANPGCALRNQSPKCPPREGSTLSSGRKNARRRWRRPPNILMKFASRQGRLSLKRVSRARPAWPASKS